MIMRKAIFITICILFVNTSFSQTKTPQKIKSTEVKKEEQVTTVSSDNNVYTHVSVGQKKEEPVRDIAYWNNYINSVESKVATVKADPVENEKALKSGWYEDMQKNIDHARAEIQKLKVKANTNK